MSQIINNPINSLELTTLNTKQKQALLSLLLEQKKQKSLTLSTAQERMWQLDQIIPGNPVYNFQSAIRLKGKLDHDALTKAANDIVKKHSTLRTCYDHQQGKAKLTLLPTLTIQIEAHDWRHISTAQQRVDLQAATQATAQTSFNIAVPALFKLQSYRMADDIHVLVLTMHHIISDLLSLDIFFEELGLFYSQYTQGMVPLITKPEKDYQDYARVERQTREKLLASDSADFWRQHLAQAPKLEWFSDFPRSKVNSNQAITAHFIIEPEVVSAIENLARSEQVTPFVVLLSVFYLLQWRLSGSDDQLIAVPNAGRNSADTEGLIGMFSSPLPMRIHLSEEFTFKTLLQQVKKMVLAVSEYADLPFADIVDLAQNASEGQPLFIRSMFSFINRMKALSFAGLELQRLPTERGISDFDFFMTIYRDQASWRGVFEYNAGIFAQARGDEWTNSYIAMLNSVVKQGVEQSIVDLSGQINRPKHQQIALAATFTADPLLEVIDFWRQTLKIPISLELAPYNQIFQTLLDPASVFFQKNNTLNVLLIRPEDWIRYTADPDQQRETLTNVTQDFIDIVRQVKFKIPLVIYCCQPSHDVANRESIDAATAQISQALSDLPGITLLDSQSFNSRYGLASVFDQQANEIGHIPYSQSWFTAMATELIRRSHAMLRTPYKVIALDCDNTLWQGVCAEEGALAVKISPPYQALQQFVLAQIEAGMLVCLVSKNEEMDVFQVFDTHPNMLLKREQIVAHRINWQAKSDNLHSIAEELQLGIDSFIFIDDNPVECAQVSTFCPQVLTLCLPQDSTQIASFLDHVWAFDKYQISHEDRQRTVQYIQNKKREALRHEQGLFSAFLANLKLRVDYRVTDDDDHLLRIAQLSHRTNQFNNSGIHYEPAELKASNNSAIKAVAIHVEDRFGSYGLVGALVYQIEQQTLYIQSFILSCRVLGKGVEHQMLAWIGEQALTAGVTSIAITCKKLPRNQPFYRFLDGLAGHRDDSANVFIISSQNAARTQFNPDQQSESSTTEVKQTNQVSHLSDIKVVQQQAMIEVANNYRNAEQILSQLDKSHYRNRAIEVSDTPPQGQTEQAIATIWQEVLRINSVNRDDNFFEIGGNSLLLVQVNGRLNECFRSDIAITTLFQFPTISSLAQHLSSDTSSNENNTNVLNRAGHARTKLQHRMQHLKGERRFRGRDVQDS